jgi:1-acyl-sn-glycerol-3-phosphate acyltransferase
MPENPRPSPLYLLIGAFSYPVLKGLYRFSHAHVERVPASGGYVLAANHLSNADPWPLGMALFPRRYLRFMAKSELFWFPLGQFIGACGAFPVRRGERDQDAIDTAVRLCREGHVVVMFPEGTRRAKGLRKRREARWRSGAARIALEAGVPLVPAGIRGTDGLSRLSRLRVVFGDPIEVGDLAGLPIDDAAHTATERLSATIGALEASLR